MATTYPNMTLAQIRAAARQRADMVNSTFVTDDEFTGFINASYAELYDLLIMQVPGRYSVSTTTIITDGANDHFALPDDFYRLLGVELQINGSGAASSNGWVSLRSFNYCDRNNYVYPNVQVTFGILSNLKYALEDDNIWFIPLPSSGQTIRLRYNPVVVPLEEETDEARGLGGWLEFVVVDAARKALLKEESDASALTAEREAIKARILQMAGTRDAGTPGTVRDTQGGMGAHYGTTGFGRWW